jgi:hypothetical protein
MSIDVRDAGAIDDRVTGDHALAQPLVRDELQTVVTMLCERFPRRSRIELEWLVTDLYHRLSENARIRTHLIPLTLNASRRALSQHHSGATVSTSTEGT